MKKSEKSWWKVALRSYVGTYVAEGGGEANRVKI